MQHDRPDERPPVTRQVSNNAIMVARAAERDLQPLLSDMRTTRVGPECES